MKPHTSDQTITVKCPDCGHEFPLSEAVLGSVRDGIRKELSADAARRERALDEKLTAVTAREEKLGERAAELDKEVQKRLSPTVVLGPNPRAANVCAKHPCRRWPDRLSPR